MLPIEIKQIYNILTYLFGESKQGSFSSNETQYQFNSPWAREENDGVNDNKYNLEVSLSLGKYHEWVNGYGGNLSKLIKRWGNSELVSKYYSVINDIKESKYYNLDLFKDTEISNTINQLTLPITFTKINIEKCKKKKLLDYLKERKIDQNMIDFYNIGYTTWDEEEWQMRDRIIIPSYNSNNELNYWVGRDFTKNEKKIKYKNCNADKKKVIFQENKIRWNADILLCEGAIDCLVYYNAISLLGKSLTKDSELFNSLFEKANANITICLDGDVQLSEIKRMYSLLNVGRLRGKIWYIKLGTETLPWKDFGEAYQEGGKENIIKIMSERQQFSEIELLI